jgi:thiol-disulfide isomerase/thioredoxin
MKKYKYISLILFVSAFLYAGTSFSQSTVPVFDLSQFQKRVMVKNDTLYIVNFWATWCKPCVEELPSFQKASQTFSSLPVKIILVSMDMRSRGSQVSEFLQKNNYTSETFILSAGNPNVWIDKIEPKWTGAIPITLFYKNGKKIYFYEGDYPDDASLEKIIHSKLK